MTSPPTRFKVGTWRMGAIERYVLIQQARALMVALAVIAALVMLIDFVEVSRGVGSDVDLSGPRILGLVLLKSPTVIIQMLPFVFLFGTLGAFVALNRRSELVAMRAAGLSAWRFVLPAAGGALAFGLLVITVLGPLASAGDGLFQRERERLSSQAAAPRTEGPQPIWLREGDESRQMIIRAARQDRAQGRLLGVSFFIYSNGDNGRRIFSERLDAESASLRAGKWHLINAVGARIGQQRVRYATLDLPSSLADEEAFARFARPQATSFWSLPNQISRVEAAGFSTTAYRLRLHQLLATPLMLAAMSMLAAAFSLRLMRLGDLSRMIAFAVLLGFAFFFVNQAAAAFGSAEVIPPFLAAWLPPVVTLLAAVTLLLYTEDG
jgi:Predicted permeases